MTTTYQAIADAVLQRESDAYHATQEERILREEPESPEAARILKHREQVRIAKAEAAEKEARAVELVEQKARIDKENQRTFHIEQEQLRTKRMQAMILRALAILPYVLLTPRNIEKLSAKLDNMPFATVGFVSDLIEGMAKAGELDVDWSHAQKERRKQEIDGMRRFQPVPEYFEKDESTMTEAEKESFRRDTADVPMDEVRSLRAAIKRHSGPLVQKDISSPPPSFMPENPRRGEYWKVTPESERRAIWMRQEQDGQ